MRIAINEKSINENEPIDPKINEYPNKRRHVEKAPNIKYEIADLID